MISKERYESLLEKEKEIRQEISRVENTHINGKEEVQAFLKENESTPLKSSATLAELIAGRSFHMRKQQP